MSADTDKVKHLPICFGDVFRGEGIRSIKKIDFIQWDYFFREILYVCLILIDYCYYQYSSKRLLLQ